MTRIAGLTLPEAEAALMAAHPGFRVYHATGGQFGAGEYATVGNEATFADLGLPLWAPSIEVLEPVIGQWERDHGWIAPRSAA